MAFRMITNVVFTSFRKVLEMFKSRFDLAIVTGTIIVLMVSGCSDLAGPGMQTTGMGFTTGSTVVSQDLAQLSVAGVTGETTTGVFSIGWKKFVGPDISQSGTIGEAYAVVQSDTSTTIRPRGIDIGAVTLAYGGGSTELTKRVHRDSSVLYETFSKGMHLNPGIPVNIPFVANGTYTFSVTGSNAFAAGTFPITAPASLLSMSGHANGDTVSRSADLVVQWNGGGASDSVLVRIVPHLRPMQLAGRELHDGLDSLAAREGMCGPRPHRHGPFAMGGPLEGRGPEFARGIVVTVPNTGTYTLSASDLQTLLGGTEATELMIGVTQVVKKQVNHDGGTVTVLLRNGDRLVLHVK
jgi:hypothetical protein